MSDHGREYRNWRYASAGEKVRYCLMGIGTYQGSTSSGLYVKCILITCPAGRSFLLFLPFHGLHMKMYMTMPRYPTDR